MRRGPQRRSKRVPRLSAIGATALQSALLAVRTRPMRVAAGGSVAAATIAEGIVLLQLLRQPCRSTIPCAISAGPAPRPRNPAPFAISAGPSPRPRNPDPFAISAGPSPRPRSPNPRRDGHDNRRPARSVRRSYECRPSLPASGAVIAIPYPPPNHAIILSIVRARIHLCSRIYKRWPSSIGRYRWSRPRPGPEINNAIQTDQR